VTGTCCGTSVETLMGVLVMELGVVVIVVWALCELGELGEWWREPMNGDPGCDCGGRGEVMTGNGSLLCQNTISAKPSAVSSNKNGRMRLFNNIRLVISLKRKYALILRINSVHTCEP
jgi:hypothetical protein